MALVMHPDKAMKFREIAKWISRTFVHYKHAYIRFGDIDTDGHFSLHIAPGSHLEEFVEGLRSIDLPAEVTPRDGEEGGFTLRARLDEALVHLEEALGFQRQGIFPFLQLPTELREKIYGMVFRCPASGISPTCNRYSGERQFAFVTNNFQSAFAPNVWAEARQPYLHRRPTSKKSPRNALGLLLVNKQIFKEAFRHFYENNLFYFHDTSDLASFLRNTPAYRRQHLTRIAFNYNSHYQDDKLAAAAFKYLASLPNVKRLHIHGLDPSVWQFLPPAQYEARVLEMPGLSALKSVSGLEKVVFSGNCPTVERMLKPVMEGPKSKKRKSAAVEVEAWGRPKRAVQERKKVKP